MQQRLEKIPVQLFSVDRQRVDKDCFAQAPYPSLQRWLEIFLGSERFAAVMKKYSIWHPGDLPVIMSNKVNL